MIRSLFYKCAIALLSSATQCHHTGLTQRVVRHVIDGGEGNEGWMYVSLTEVMAAWGDVHGCNSTNVIVTKTPFDGGQRKLHCESYTSCSHHKSENVSNVQWCLFDGYHGDWPNPFMDELGLEALQWWFFNQTRWEGKSAGVTADLQ